MSSPERAPRPSARWAARWFAALRWLGRRRCLTVHPCCVVVERVWLDLEPRRRVVRVARALAELLVEFSRVGQPCRKDRTCHARPRSMKSPACHWAKCIRREHGPRLPALPRGPCGCTRLLNVSTLLLVTQSAGGGMGQGACLHSPSTAESCRWCSPLVISAPCQSAPARQAESGLHGPLRTRWRVDIA
jgi:hypothetical protein